MDKTDIINDQLLGTFIDGELDAANQAVIINAMETDQRLRERVYQLRRAKDLMQLGFGDATPPSQPQSRQRRHPLFSVRLAASVAALAISFGAGMLGHQYLANTPGNPTAIAGASQQQAGNIILHVSQSDRRQFERALDFTEQFLREHTANGAEIEVVAHASGLDLMRDDISPLRERIRNLMQQNENIHFIGCANAIKLLRTRGTEPHIIQGVNTESTAFDHIVNRLQGGGWKYIKVESLPGA